jgi:hypothetical protein
MRSFIVFICLFYLSHSYAQNEIDILWQACFGGSHFDYASDIIPTENGYLVFGESRSDDGQVSNNHGGSDIWIVRIDSLGGIIWERSYGGSQTDLPNNIIRYNGNQYYFGGGVASNDGDIQSGNLGGYDRWIVKINGDGEIIWEKCYGGTMTEYGGYLKLLTNGNILTYGATFSGDIDVPVNYGFLDVWLMIITPQGEIVQSEVFGNMGQNNIFDIIETSDGGFFMACKAQGNDGMVQGDFHGNTDVWVVKLDSGLNIEWQKLYGGFYTDYGYQGVLELEDGYIFLSSTNSNDFDVSGLHGSPGVDNPRDIWVVRIDSIGNILWQRCLGGSDWDWSSTVHQAEDGGFIIVGETASHNGDVSNNHSYPNSGNSDIWMVKLSADGELEWEKCYGGLGNERIYKGVIHKNDNNWILAGRTSENSDDVNCDQHGQEDYWVFEIGVEDTTGIFDTYAFNNIIKVYPNPATDYIIIEVESSKLKFQSSASSIKIVDVFGQEVTTIRIVSEKTVFDCRPLESGIYFYLVEVDLEYYSGKIVVQN